MIDGNSKILVADDFAAMRRIIKNSTIFARLQKEVMFALSSKYALALYEMIQKRGNMRRNSEEFSPGDSVAAPDGFTYVCKFGYWEIQGRPPKR